MKHTEGEWKVEAKNLIKCNGEQIGSANSMIDEYEANAKLISAAPNILDALKAIIKTNGNIAINDKEWINAIKAINKATK